MSLSLIAGVIVFGLCQAAPGGGDNLEFSDLPEDEFCKQKARMHKPTFSTGLQLPKFPEQRVDEASEIYFNQFRYSRSSVPDSYNASSNGLVSPIKNQGKCGSCVAFASMSIIETCFKKVTGVFGDYSEQQMVDCGYGINGADGCVIASYHAYLTWAVDYKVKFASELQYPYKDMLSTFQCPSNLPVYDQGAQVTGTFYTTAGDEEMLKRLVYEHGSVLAGVAIDPMRDYSGGIFEGCRPGLELTHAVSVIGYGTENGVDYWLIKNSWGRCWGEKGFGKIKRGVGMCGIGTTLATVTCGPSA